MEHLKTMGRELAMVSRRLRPIQGVPGPRQVHRRSSIQGRRRAHLTPRDRNPKTMSLRARIPKCKMKEYIIRLIYVEMLGNDGSFAYIHAVKMTHDDNLLLKCTGYLAKDLKSDNYLVACAALNAVCKLINDETVPAVLPQVVDLLAHPKEAVRKKASRRFTAFIRIAVFGFASGLEFPEAAL
ncbi:AP-4 complex subunit epsilon [Prunus yedoensis var. nudiflora]|uniref:AP-4 complex subunit epsilon n=1 Tax=Prunus yedoensis var. nudiflora TaxID=2094558 RepID=A0A314Y295_PRUYE|nr:AP-4 complex subunit epsilon [Prunus yedoensis var. nudiflora]